MDRFRFAGFLLERETEWERGRRYVLRFPREERLRVQRIVLDVLELASLGWLPTGAIDRIRAGEGTNEDVLAVVLAILPITPSVRFPEQARIPRLLRAGRAIASSAGALRAIRWVGKRWWFLTGPLKRSERVLVRLPSWRQRAFAIVMLLIDRELTKLAKAPFHHLFMRQIERLGLWEAIAERGEVEAFAVAILVLDRIRRTYGIPAWDREELEELLEIAKRILSAKALKALERELRERLGSHR